MDPKRLQPLAIKIINKNVLNDATHVNITHFVPAYINPFNSYPLFSSFEISSFVNIDRINFRNGLTNAINVPIEHIISYEANNTLKSGVLRNLQYPKKLNELSYTFG